MSAPLVFLNRRFIPENEAGVSVFDRGLLYGDGLFETVRVYDGKFFRLRAHIRRMYEGLKILGIKPPFTQEEMEIFTRELAITNRVEKGFARLVITRGEGILGFSPRGSVTPHVAICVRQRTVAMRAKEIWSLRIHPHLISPIPLKSLSYLPHVLAKKEAEEAGFDDAILLNLKNEVVECSGSNLFLWEDSKLITPSLASGCLPGITRAEIIKVARQEGHHVIEKTVKPNDLHRADGIFLSNSLMEIVPARIGKKKGMDSETLSLMYELEASFAYHRITSLR
ncbi:MAG: aminotransferase class IV [Verrucomicrobiae bacterium]|nr:aminotransferase class IV [Verrucomicrobiae bacterium]